MSAPTWALLGANLIPFLLVAGGFWNLREVLTLYWLETGIIGFFNIFRIILAAGPPDPGKSGCVFPGGMPIVAKCLLAGFFTLHFGGFMAGHGVFLFGVVLGGFKGGAIDVREMLYSVRWAAAALFLSHGMSFYFNYLRGGERFRVSSAQCMQQPYSRIVVMHLTIILGAFVSLVFRDPGAVLPLFIGLKIFVDLKAHRREREKFGPAQPAAA